MLREKDSRPAGNRAAHDLGGSSAPTLPAKRAYPANIRLSDTAEAYIAGFAIGLMLDEVQLSQLPPALLEFYTYAFEAGRTIGLASREGIDRLRFEADLWYWCYTNRKAPGEWYRHATDELWAEASR